MLGTLPDLQGWHFFTTPWSKESRPEFNITIRLERDKNKKQNTQKGRWKMQKEQKDRIGQSGCAFEFGLTMGVIQFTMLKYKQEMGFKSIP